MQKQKLPNSITVLILGIFSIITPCFFLGGISCILGITALFLTNKDTKLYKQNTEYYSGYANLQTGKILAIIGLILSIPYLVYSIYMVITIGFGVITSDPLSLGLFK